MPWGLWCRRKWRLTCGLRYLQTYIYNNKNTYATPKKTAPFHIAWHSTPLWHIDAARLYINNQSNDVQIQVTNKRLKRQTGGAQEECRLLWAYTASHICVCWVCIRYDQTHTPYLRGIMPRDFNNACIAYKERQKKCALLLLLLYSCCMQRIYCYDQQLLLRNCEQILCVWMCLYIFTLSTLVGVKQTNKHLQVYVRVRVRVCVCAFVVQLQCHTLSGS